jgi:hypothetical protein
MVWTLEALSANFFEGGVTLIGVNRAPEVRR